MGYTIQRIFKAVERKFDNSLVEEMQQSSKFYPAVHNFMNSLEDEIINLEDKLHRRNIQIADLKQQIEQLNEWIAGNEQARINNA